MKRHNTPCGQVNRPPRPRLRGPGLALALAAAGMLALPAAFLPSPASARDTDIYGKSPNNNAYIMVDRSGSMHYWVYEHSIDWAALYDNFMTRNDLSIKEVRAKFPDKKKNLEGGSGTSSLWVGQYIFDSYNQDDGGGFRGYDIIANGPDDEHGLHYEKDRIYLVNWNIEVKVVNGVAITGDMPKSATGHRTKHWDKRVAQRTGKWEDALIAIDTKARLDENGNIVLEPGSMLSFAPDDPEHSHVLLNGKPLPLGQDLPEHKYIPLKNGTKLDNGFVGYLQSPGFVNSGYKSVPDGVGPYLGEASDKSLAATDKAREMLLADKATMKTWNLQQWQAWADARFTADNSPDGTTWRDWRKAQTKWKSDNTVFWDWKKDELNQPAEKWDASDWRIFINHIDYDYQSSDKYFCVILPNGKGGQQRGTFLLGRWAQAMYEKNLPEKQKWQQLAGAWEEETDGHNWLYAFVTGNYLNYVQAITLRYIDSPGLKGKTLQYPYPEPHTEANRDKNGGTVYQFGLSEITANETSYIPREQPQFDRYYVDEKGRLSVRDNARYASMNPLFYEGWPDRQGKRVQNRFEALRSALVHTLDNYGDRMNWGFAAYPRKKAPNDRGYIHGATDKSFAGVWEDEQGNPRSTLLDLTRDPAALLKDVREKASTTGAGGGTPMTGSLQHVWYNGFHKPYTEGKLGREEDCGKYYVITLADGMASVDFNHSAYDSCYGEYFGYDGNCRRKEPIVPLDAPIHPNYKGRRPPSYAKPFAQCDTGALGSAKNKGSWDALPGFQNWDCDYWRNDASQGDGGTVATLYDDVAVYMYTHSFKTGEEICNPFDTDSGKAAACRQTLKDSKENVKGHHISLGLTVPAMRDAAETTGGKYFVASNKEQLIAVFEDLATGMIDESVAFSSPTVGADPNNKLESGSEMYSGTFMPLEDQPWLGNVMKYKWGKEGDTCSSELSDEELAECLNWVFGKGDVKLTGPDGQFKGGLDYWGDPDGVDLEPVIHNADGGEMTKENGDPLVDNGAGEVLLRDVRRNLAAGEHYKRNIYTATCETEEVLSDGRTVCKSWKMVRFTPENITPQMLGLAADDTDGAVALVNYMHGYKPAAGTPTEARDWPLGAVMHSQPVPVDYYDATGVNLLQRYVAAGSQDGMLHVFNDGSDAVTGDGREVFAFIPPDLLKLSDVEKERLKTEFRDRKKLIGEEISEAAWNNLETELSADGISDAEFIEKLGSVETNEDRKIADMTALAKMRPRKLRDVPNYDHDNPFDGVDGTITIVRGGIVDEFPPEPPEAKLVPSHLIFGERRGGGNYWCLHIQPRNPVTDGNEEEPNWTVLWNFAPPEMAQSWSDVLTARVLVGVNAETGMRTYRRVAVFSGGYDPIEDNYPEKFKDDSHSSPLDEMGRVKPDLWSPTPVMDGAAQKWVDGRRVWKQTEYDANANGEYDVYNKDGDRYGRGIWIVDLEDPTKEFGSVGGKPVLPFSVTYTDDADDVREGNAQTRNDMRYSFPATPSVVPAADIYSAEGSRHTITAVMRALYVPDIYANMWKVRLNLRAMQDCEGHWQLAGLGAKLEYDEDNKCRLKDDPLEKGWQVHQLFTTHATVNSLKKRLNDAGNEQSSYCRAGDDCAVDKSYEQATTWDNAGKATNSPVRDLDRGQKAFYGPTVSWTGVKDYFQPSNFNYRDPENGIYSFLGREQIAALFYGTGDPEHPTWTITHNRVYSLYDDTSITAREDAKDVNILDQPDDCIETPKVDVTLPADGGDYQFTVSGKDVVATINLTDDYNGTIIVPSGVKRLVINTNGYSITGADGTFYSPDGKPAIQLVNSDTEVVVNGNGKVQGGKGTTGNATWGVSASLNEKCEYTLNERQKEDIVNRNLSLSLRLNDDCEGTLVIPNYVPAVLLWLSGHEIEAEDGQPAIRFENPATNLVIYGQNGKIKGGDGKNGQDAGDVFAGIGKTVYVHGTSGKVQLEPGEAEGDGRDGELGAVVQTADSVKEFAYPVRAGNGGQAISGADGDTSIYAPGGATVAGGERGGGDGNADVKDGGICGLDDEDKEICSLLDTDPPEIDTCNEDDDDGDDGDDSTSKPEGKLDYTKAHYSEADLMNLTCGELDDETEFTEAYIETFKCDGENPGSCQSTEDVKTRLRTLLTDDAVVREGEYKGLLERTSCGMKTDPVTQREYLDCSPKDDDYKGKYIVLDRQADPTYCAHVSSWRHSVDRGANGVDNHAGEQIMARTTLLAGVVYFTSYQPLATLCGSGGNARIYSMDYATAGSVKRSANYVYSEANYGDAVGLFKTFQLGENVGIPTSMSVVHQGKGYIRGAFSVGPYTFGPEDSDEKGLKAWDPNPPLQLDYWRDTNSRNPYPHYFRKEQ